jgi:hypothetical protein
MVLSRKISKKKISIARLLRNEKNIWQKDRQKQTSKWRKAERWQGLTSGQEAAKDVAYVRGVAKKTYVHSMA